MLSELTPILIILGVILLLFLSFRLRTKKEKDYDKFLHENLNDEYIVDPETGTKITLEQAESGHWIAHDNEFLAIKERHFTKEDKEAEEVINYVRTSKEYRKQDLSEEKVDLLVQSKILSKYSDWGYAHPFKLEFGNGIVFFPAVRYDAHYEDYFEESQIMFCLNLGIPLGHYYLREKSKTEKFFDRIRKDDDLSLDNYESYTFKKSENLVLINQIINELKGSEGLEFEFINSYLLVKSTKFINMSDFVEMEKIIKTLC